jgi:hypothetical protein
MNDDNFVKQPLKKHQKRVATIPETKLHQAMTNRLITDLLTQQEYGKIVGQRKKASPGFTLWLKKWIPVPAFMRLVFLWACKSKANSFLDVIGTQEWRYVQGSFNT